MTWLEFLYAFRATDPKLDPYKRHYIRDKDGYCPITIVFRSRGNVLLERSAIYENELAPFHARDMGMSSRLKAVIITAADAKTTTSADVYDQAITRAILLGEL